jgi:phasin family protein
MYTIPEQFSVATKANFESQIAMLTSLTNKAFEGVEKLIDLNLNIVKESLEESTATAKQLMEAKDPQEFFTLASSQTKPSTDKAVAYGREVVGIASNTQAEFTKAAEHQMTETNRKVMSLVEEVTKNAPAGSESAVAMMKSTISSVNAGYEQMSKATKQAVEALDSNMATAATQFSQAAAKATSKPSPKK